MSAAAVLGSILRYDGITGEPLGTFVASGVGWTSVPHDGFLYVNSSSRTKSCGLTLITGAPAGISGVPGDAVFIASGSGGLDSPYGIAFCEGDFFVLSYGNELRAALRGGRELSRHVCLIRQWRIERRRVIWSFATDISTLRVG